MRILIVAVITLLSVLPAQAQTLKSATWTQGAEVTTDTPAVTMNKAAAYKYTMKIDTMSADLLAVSCAVASAAVQCTGQLPPTLITQLAVFGPHNMTLTASNAVTSATSDPVVFSAPIKPVNISLTITVTIVP